MRIASKPIMVNKICILFHYKFWLKDTSCEITSELVTNGLFVNVDQ